MFLISAEPEHLQHSIQNLKVKWVLYKRTPCVASWTKIQHERDFEVLWTVHLEKCWRKRN